MIREVARREIVTRGRSKAFRITTAVIAPFTVLFVAGAVVFGSDDDADDVIIKVGVEENAEGFNELFDAAGYIGLQVEVTEFTGDEIGPAVENHDIDVGVRSGDTLVWNAEPDPFVQSLLVEALRRQSTIDRATELGLDTDAVDTLLAPVEIRTELLDPPDDSSAARTVVATLGVFILFFAIQLYGSQIAMVVVEEKANRIVEILLALVRPKDLLVGKLIGVGALAAVQIIIPIVGLLAALRLSGFADVPASAYASLPLLFVSFVLGFTLFGTMFALVGSLVSRQEDAQQALFPVFIPIMTGYLLALQAVASPDSTLAYVASIVPFTSPFVLPVTVAQGVSSPLIVVISLALLAATAVGILALAARIYEFTLLRTGSRVTLGQALRLARR